jgi:hypothetical protein
MSMLRAVRIKNPVLELLPIKAQRQLHGEKIELLSAPAQISWAGLSLDTQRGLFPQAASRRLLWSLFFPPRTNIPWQ